jgi:nitrogen fixation NifU-like protein
VERQAQIDFILNHYQNPRYYGRLENATATHTGVNTGCGDVITFYLAIGPDERVTDVSFEGQGCTVSLATASMVAEMITGSTLVDVLEMSPNSVLGLVGAEIANTRSKCVLLGLNTAKEAAKDGRRNSRDPDDV